MDVNRLPSNPDVYVIEYFPDEIGQFDIPISITIKNRLQNGKKNFSSENKNEFQKDAHRPRQGPFCGLEGGLPRHPRSDTPLADTPSLYHNPTLYHSPSPCEQNDTRLLKNTFHATRSVITRQTICGFFSNWIIFHDLGLRFQPWIHC